jgi:hypothetical protein
MDAKNLFGKAMSDFLPYGGFQWLDTSQTINIEDLDDEGEYGYFFKVDVSYPDELHDEHSDLPFLAEKLAPPGSKFKKLLTTLKSKEKYVAHYRSLKQAMKWGLKITKIHRGINLEQSRWLAPYIDLNTRLRKNAKTILKKTCSS